ncbi:hypothetical protein [Lacticaseibacillus kribbianus]|uniref:hypothetical protein n=1 Tax=Lacticaseibacillus kribbianus TaxID=2926292 RepID=UPI001CD376A6|nr:hypothetical protein [Lacticaseibacillus kribbianus]
MSSLEEKAAQHRLAQLGGPINLVRPLAAAQLETYWDAIRIGMPTVTATQATFTADDTLGAAHPVAVAREAEATVPAAAGVGTPGTARTQVFGATTSGRAVAGSSQTAEPADAAAVSALVTAAASAGATGWLLQDEGRAAMLIHQPAADLLIVCSQLVCRSADCHCW